MPVQIDVAPIMDRLSQGLQWLERKQIDVHLENGVHHVKVPVAQGAMFLRTTNLLTVKANYYCHVRNADLKTDPVRASVKRPIKVRGPPSRNISAQVAIEVMRAIVLEKVHEISTRSWRDDDGVRETTMTDELKTIQDSIIGEEAKDRWDDISMDLDDMQDSDTGLVYMLSWLSSHQWQRAATTPGTTSSASFSFRTTRMNNMIDSVETAPL